MQKISFNDFISIFKPILSDGDKYRDVYLDVRWPDETIEGLMTIQKINKENPHMVWTIICPENEVMIVPGYRVYLYPYKDMQRLGFALTENPWHDDIKDKMYVHITYLHN